MEQLEWYDKCIHHQLYDEEDEYRGLIQAGWYFLDETWNAIGPYTSREEAVEAIKKYADGL